jgi:hypothetical protein
MDKSDFKCKMPFTHTESAIGDGGGGSGKVHYP